MGKDPFNMYQGSSGHLSAEDRRIMRVMVKHHLRRSPHYPQAVYEIERKLIEGFGKNPTLRGTFFMNEDFANKFLSDMVLQIDTDGLGKKHGDEDPLQFEKAARIVPGSHHYACGPQCYCLKFQDSALLAKPKEGSADDFVDTFASK